MIGRQMSLRSRQYVVQALILFQVNYMLIGELFCSARQHRFCQADQAKNDFIPLRREQFRIEA